MSTPNKPYVGPAKVNVGLSPAVQRVAGAVLSHRATSRPGPIDVTNLEAHPIATRYPLLEGDEYAAFKASVKANGQRVAIVLFGGKILDGRNRYRACVELGIVPKAEVFNGTEADAAVYSDVLNLDRRHLTREQKREVIAYKLKENPERSDRDVAAEVKASPSTVAAVRKAISSGVQVGHLEEKPEKGVTGRTGEEETPAPVPEAERKVKGKDQKTYTVKPSSAKSRSSSGAVAPHKGLSLADKAIEILESIPKGDALRESGIKLVERFVTRQLEDDATEGARVPVEKASKSSTGQGKRMLCKLFRDYFHTDHHDAIEIVLSKAKAAFAKIDSRNGQDDRDWRRIRPDELQVFRDLVELLTNPPAL